MSINLSNNLRVACKSVRENFAKNPRIRTLDDAAQDWMDRHVPQNLEPYARYYFDTVTTSGITPADLGVLKAESWVELYRQVAIRGIAILIRRNDPKLRAEELRRISA